MRSVNALTSVVLLLLGLGCVALALGSQHPQPLILAAVVCLAAFALQEPEVLPGPQSLRA
ncbi:hypothetical protein SB18R_04580 [Pseudomonas oryzihabitans]|nr:hypothetical protein [Pseudomonas rhizoryzae]KTT28529.1 hypothetical protein NS201_20120 [Pseudomonas psychrotolerans]KTT32495.1 hypothetical protein SB9_15620 [Pseudomonas psychrotolerans]KTT77938.1 hypothetical protein SB18R_04580 [Pseudomonas psychrotolerans]